MGCIQIVYQVVPRYDSEPIQPSSSISTMLFFCNLDCTSQLLRQATSIFLPDVRNHACTRLRKLPTLRRVISRLSSLRMRTTQESCTTLGCGSDMILHCKAKGSANTVIDLSFAPEARVTRPMGHLSPCYRYRWWMNRGRRFDHVGAGAVLNHIKTPM